MTTTDTIGLSEDQAVERLLGTPEEEPEQEAETTVEDSDEAPAEREQTDEDEDETEDADQGKDEDEDDSEDTEVENGPQLFTVKVNGEEKQVPIEELIRGYAGQSYVQKGMQENAQTRKQAQEALQALQAERERLTSLYQSLEQGGLPQAPKKPDPRMLDTDPIGYMAAKDQYDTAKAEYDQRMAEFGKTREEHARTQQQMMQAFVAEQQKLLQQQIPEFADPAKRTALQEKLRKVGQEYGFSEQELSGIADARVVRVLHAAMRLKELQDGKKAKVAEKAPTVIPPKKSAETPKARKAKELRQRLKQTGSIEDAVAFLTQT